MFGALAILAAACSDSSALGRPMSAPFTEEVAMGPTITAPPTITMPTIPPLPPVPPPPPPPAPVTVLAVGNLGRCNAHSNQVLDAVTATDDVIVAAGDLLIEPAVAAAGECSLDSLTGQLDRLYAVPGDVDVTDELAASFYDLVDQTPTDSTPDEGWFITTLGGWQLIGLNSRCSEIGGCGVDSPQYQWLDTVLREQPADCRVVVWHDARFTSASQEVDAADMGGILGRLDGAGTDVLITGSPGNYERLGLTRPSGQLAAEGAAGIMHFNIGGGSGVGFQDKLQPATQVRIDDANGYVRFVFSAASYTWEFVATSEGNASPDIGSGTC